jgi:hypothetical protein
MSKQGFTPGPWTVAAKDLGGEGPSWRVHTDDGQEVAKVHRWNGEGDEANAHLIAAAPMMLVALEALAAWPRRSATLDGELSGDPVVGLANVRRFARAAIAKAKGE